MPVNIFCCYAHEDILLLAKLKIYLKPLQRKGLINVWHDGDISAGIEWEKEINEQLNKAHIILLLVSPDFIASDYCYSVEMARAIERHKQGEARVIPIILRPTLWQDDLLGKLQALPTDGIPMTDSSHWQNIDNAFFNVTKGIDKVIKEITIQLLARKISLFGYETDGGTTSLLWHNPLTFSPNEDYDAWGSMKRNITKEEIVDHRWIKVSSYGDYWIIHFHSDDRLDESPLSDPGNDWPGSWQLIDDMLRINIGNYEIDVFANRESSIYSAIEFENGHKKPRAYYVFFPYPKAEAKHWSLEEIYPLIEQVCKQILDREAKPRDLILFGSLLHRGESSLRNVIKFLGLSSEYRKHYINGRTTDEVISLCYEHFLGRKADDEGKTHYNNKTKKTGYDAFIAELIDSPEYRETFGEDIIPSQDWLETSVNTIRIELASPKPMATIQESPIPVRGRVGGLSTGRYFIVAYVIVNKEYEQEKAVVHADGSWMIDKVYFNATSHRLFFRIFDDRDKLIAESKETTIVKS